MTRRSVDRTGTRAPVLLALLLTVSIGALVAPGAARAATIGHSVGPRVYQGGGVIGFGDAVDPGNAAPLPSVMVALAVNPASTPTDQGYWLAGADGSVYPEGLAASYGSLASLRLQAPVVSMSATPDGKGYWLVAIDGGVFAFGDAAFYGSMGGTPLNQPIVGMATTPDGRGYWLVAADGGIFAFGDASFHGSMGGSPLNAPVTGMAATGDGNGYWLVASDGGMFSFGDAPFFGSMGGLVLNDPVVAMVATPSGGGYLLVATDGGIFRFGSAPFYGSLGAGYGGNPADVPPVAGIAFTPDALGYWLLEPDGWSYSFSNPPDPSPSGTAAAIVSIANSQVSSDPVRGYFCNPYGPCEAWCALFATWVWQQAGIPIPSYPFTGNIYNWAAAHGQVLPPTATPLPGDAVLYGTGPSSASTSLHVGLVVQTWPDGAIVTVEGDAGPAPTGSLAVIINGPYLPSRSAIYNGMPIYAFARP
ncbi:MAG TPA: CHAP domain-containing protein [Acidimicrobiales bacterium]